MRNPLNAIIGQNVIHQEILDRLNSWIEAIREKLTEQQVEEINEILADYKKDN